MNVTLGCLTFNEERFLPQLLRSVADSPLIEAIVIVDTGSTDSTPQLARAHGAKVLHRAPVTSFADARNSLLAEVDSDWLLFLDADEQPGPGMLKGIEELLTEDHADLDAATFLRYNFFANGSFYLSRETKLLRMGAHPRYSGRAAETVGPSLAGPPLDLPLILNHFGHSRSRHLRDVKAHRYLDLIEQEMKSVPSRAAGLSRTAALIERSIGLTAQAKDRIKQVEEMFGRTAATAFTRGHTERADPDGWPATKYFAQARSLNDDDPSLVNLHAVSLLCDGAAETAVHLLQDAVRRWPHLPHLRLNLGLAHQFNGEPADALLLLDAVAAEYPAFRYEEPAGRLEFDPWRPLMSETIPGYAGLDYHRAYLRTVLEGNPAHVR